MAVVYLRPVSVLVAVMLTPGSGMVPDLTEPWMTPPVWTADGVVVEAFAGCCGAGEAACWPAARTGAKYADTASKSKTEMRQTGIESDLLIRPGGIRGGRRCRAGLVVSLASTTKASRATRTAGPAGPAGTTWAANS